MSAVFVVRGKRRGALELAGKRSWTEESREERRTKQEGPKERAHGTS
jgi:hypothetical protein